MSEGRFCNPLFRTVIACLPNASLIKGKDVFTQATSATTRLQRVTATLMLVAACLLFGAAIGHMAVSLFSAESASGLDGLADISGGLLVGGLLGSIAGGYLARDLTIGDALVITIFWGWLGHSVSCSGLAEAIGKRFGKFPNEFYNNDAAVVLQGN